MYCSRRSWGRPIRGYKRVRLWAQSSRSLTHQEVRWATAEHSTQFQYGPRCLVHFRRRVQPPQWQVAATEVFDRQSQLLLSLASEVQLVGLGEDAVFRDAERRQHW